MAPSRCTRVYVVDDHPLFLEGLARAVWMSPGLELVGSARSGEQAISDIRGLDPDVAVMDAGVGARLLATVQRERLRTRVVLLSEHLKDDLVYEALAAGAAGYLSKEMDRESILGAVAAAASGRIDLPHEVQMRLVLEVRRREALSRPSLTAGEMDMLGLLAEGRTTTQIGARLQMSDATVKTHLRKTYEKLGVADRTAAVAVAIRRGLLD
jgi:two-component system nitrate/nitrite response regulator NarL